MVEPVKLLPKYAHGKHEKFSQLAVEALSQSEICEAEQRFNSVSRQSRFKDFGALGTNLNLKRNPIFASISQSKT